MRIRESSAFLTIYNNDPATRPAAARPIAYFDVRNAAMKPKASSDGERIHLKIITQVRLSQFI